MKRISIFACSVVIALASSYAVADASDECIVLSKQLTIDAMVVNALMKLEIQCQDRKTTSEMLKCMRDIVESERKDAKAHQNEFSKECVRKSAPASSQNSSK